MDYTEHYALPKYVRGDAAALISGYDVSMEIIDDLLFGFDGAIKDLQARMNVAETTLENHEGRITALEQWRAEVDVWRNNVDNHIANIDNRLDENDKTWEELFKKIFGGATLNPDGSITWNVKTGLIPIGDLNIFAGIETPTSTSYSNAIRSRAAVTDKDIKAL